MEKKDNAFRAKDLSKEKIIKHVKDTMGIDVTVVGPDDTVCLECKQCGKCCTGACVNQLLLHPADVYRILKNTDMSFEELASKSRLFIGHTSGLPLMLIPVVEMNDGTPMCIFLKDGKCSIHDYKPNACRMYPLGRAIGESDVRYILQDSTCGISSTNKEIKVSDWLGDIGQSNEIAKAENKMFADIYDICDMAELRKFFIEAEMQNVGDAFYNHILQLMYDFDTERDILEQIPQRSLQIQLAVLAILFQGFIQPQDSLTEKVKDIVKVDDIAAKAKELIAELKKLAK